MINISNHARPSKKKSRHTYTNPSFSVFQLQQNFGLPIKIILQWHQTNRPTQEKKNRTYPLFTLHARRSRSGIQEVPITNTTSSSSSSSPSHSSPSSPCPCCSSCLKTPFGLIYSSSFSFERRADVGAVCI